MVNKSTPVLSSLLSSTLSGDFSSLIMTIVVLYVTLRVADYLRRSVMAWVFFFIKVALLLVLVNAALYVNRVGVERAYKEALWLAQMAWGAVEGLFNDVNGADRPGWDSVVNRFGGGAGAGAGGSQAWNPGARQQVPLGTAAKKRRGGGSWS